MTPLAEGAAHLHELFMAYIAAGFSRAEAMQLVTAIVSTMAAAQAVSGGSDTDGS